MIVTETPRLRLRHLARADAPFILELMSDHDFLRNIGDRGVHTLEDARHYLTSGPLASYERYGFGLCAVELKASGVTIGLCGLLHRETHPDVEVGFALLPRFRGQGYALEAARAVLEFGTRELGLERLVAITRAGNEASIRILEALGLKYERTVRFTDDGESCLFVLDAARA
jgi:[ribosomal protein S5]-alanine N-acetyltransferase